MSTPTDPAFLSPARLPFALETTLERRLGDSIDWLEGLAFGQPRSGHPEGQVFKHVAQVLLNLDRIRLLPATRARLRFAALVHDSFKHQVRRDAPRTPPNEHGWIASRFAASLVNDKPLLALIELHDEGYRAWTAAHAGDHSGADRRLAQIAGRMGDELPLFMSFYWADTLRGDKDASQLDWFVAEMAKRGQHLALPKSGFEPPRVLDPRVIGQAAAGKAAEPGTKKGRFFRR